MSLPRSARTTSATCRPSTSTPAPPLRKPPKSASVPRRLADAGAELVAVPAEWVRGPLKEHHWSTLLAARAIENTLYVAAADHTPPIGVGNSVIVDPMGVVLAGLGETTGVAVAEASAERVADVRRRNPALQLRRYRVEPND